MHVQIEEGIHSVLIVEDEGLLALMMEDLVRELGATEVLVCGDLASAIATARSADIDCAVLDLEVRGGTSIAVADVLSMRSIPFLYSTGSAADGLELRHRDRPMLSKPFSDDDFKRALLDAWRADIGTFRAPDREVARAASTD